VYASNKRLIAGKRSAGELNVISIRKSDTICYKKVIGITDVVKQPAKNVRKKNVTLVALRSTYPASYL